MALPDSSSVLVKFQSAKEPLSTLWHENVPVTSFGGLLGGFQDGMKQQEMRRNEGKKDKEIEKEETYKKNSHDFVAVSSGQLHLQNWAFFNIFAFLGPTKVGYSRKYYMCQALGFF